MPRRFTWSLLLPLLAVVAFDSVPHAQTRPNIILIYADDLGYGDVSSYGASSLQTPSIDRLAKQGLRFTDAHSPAATCTPSRYALLTGEYAFRKAGTGILPGDAALVIDTDRVTLPSMLKKAGYATGVVGKWHLGLGPKGGPDWNGEIRPSPNDVGFDASFIMAATGDRVPTVYVENRRVAGLDPADPIRVSYAKPLGDDPTGRTHPELLTKMRPSHGHDQTIVNGISRIGYMTGGTAALWKDDDMADVFTKRIVRPSALERRVAALHAPERRTCRQRAQDPLLRLRARLSRSLARPLMFFGVLYAVFSQIVPAGEGVSALPSMLLVGGGAVHVLSEATVSGVESLVRREPLLRKVQFPRLAIPTSVVLVASFDLA